MEKLNYEVHSKEKIYFTIKSVISVIIYALIFYKILDILVNDDINTGPSTYVFIMYAIIIIVWLFFSAGIMAGHIQGNGISISRKQFPEIYSLIEKHCDELDMEVPPVYMIQNGGVLNAFATRFVGRNYVVIYSDIFDLAHEEGMNELSFIIAHELGHVKRKHVLKRLLLFPSFIIPFLGSAYSRACEFTCDNIGNALSPNGSKNGLMILAAGKRSFNKVNMEQYLASAEDETGFWKWFSEKVSSHPNLPNRIENLI